MINENKQVDNIKNRDSFHITNGEHLEKQNMAQFKYDCKPRTLIITQLNHPL